MADRPGHGPLPGSADAPIRHVTDDELPAFFTAMARQFGENISDESIAAIRVSCELDRTFAWFEGERIMATAETVSFAIGMPGAAAAPCAGLTAVGVNPLRRRRGILNALLRRQMDQAREREEPFGALYASESTIYGRYGYGVAAPAVRYSVATARASLRSPAPASASADLEMVDTDEALQRLPGIYDAVQAVTPGAMSRSSGRWRVFLGDLEEHRDGFSAYFHVVLADRGYVVYRLKDDWDEQAPAGTLRIVELLARDADAYAALWQLCLSMDLVSTVEAGQRPPDDALLHALTDPASAKVRPVEPLYLRLLDLPTAFAARRYAAEGGAVVEVLDAFCPWNAGRWTLDLGPDGGSAKRTDAAPELVLDVAELSGAFLGGVRLAALARGGRVEETRAGAAWDLDRLLAVDPLPWNPRNF